MLSPSGPGNLPPPSAGISAVGCFPPPAGISAVGCFPPPSAGISAVGCFPPPSGISTAGCFPPPSAGISAVGCLPLPSGAPSLGTHCQNHSVSRLQVVVGAFAQVTQALSWAHLELFPPQEAQSAGRLALPDPSATAGSLSSFCWSLLAGPAPPPPAPFPISSLAFAARAPRSCPLMKSPYWWSRAICTIV